MSKRRLVSVGAAIIAMIMSTLVLANPAEAASGGGCSRDRVGACISYSGSNRAVIADFYQNWTGDTSTCYAQMEVRTSQGTAWSPVYYIKDRAGRYGPMYVGVTSGSAVNIVHVYTCGWVQHFTPTSPRVYYP